MAPGKVASDFNAIINAGMRTPRCNLTAGLPTANTSIDRQRRKHESLAQEIFGKNRRASAPGGGLNNRKPGSGPSLASRVGIAKVDGMSLHTERSINILSRELFRLQPNLHQKQMADLPLAMSTPNGPTIYIRSTTHQLLELLNAVQNVQSETIVSIQLSMAQPRPLL
jgi:hypothetical protein